MLKGNAQSETICSENGPVTEKLQVLPDFMHVRMSSLNTHKMKNKIARAIEETVTKTSLSQKK